ncbi:MAG: PspC domain-containing protein [Prevotella sp.]|nr:PspC domain-containing protein [Prevotella sp.]
MADKRLIRSKDKWLAGICAGIAEYFGWNAGTTRLLWLLLTICTAAFPGFVAYIILWILMPEE